MKFKYGVHPSAFCPGALEDYYSAMAAKGWMLVKQGGIFSKFEKSEPKNIRYHVEYIPGISEETAITDEQMVIFKEAGWKFIGSFESDYVFVGKGKTKAPELGLTQEQRSNAMKYIKRSNGFTLAAILAAVLSIIFVTFTIDDGRSFRWAAQMYRVMIEESALFTFCLVVAVTAVICAINEIIGTRRAYNQLKDRLSISHTQCRFWRSIKKIQMVVLILCAVGWGIEYVGADRYPMPAETREPYILLSEIGVTGDRTESSMDGENSRVNLRRTVFADCWESKEFVNNGGDERWMYQNAYELRDAAMAKTLAKALMRDTPFADDSNDFKSVDVEGLDVAWVLSDRECVAFKDNRVIAITSDFDSAEDAADTLNVVAAKWQESDS